MSEIKLAAPIRPAPAVEASVEARGRAKLRRAAEAFEGLLVQQLVKQIRSAQLEQGLFGEGAGASVYNAMFDQYLGEQLARDSPFGIADLLEARWNESAEEPENTDLSRVEARRIAAEGALDAQVTGFGADD